MNCKSKWTVIWLMTEAVIAAGVYIVWATLFFRQGGGGFLSSPGFSSLRYYTVLSNLAAGAASWCCLVSYLRIRKSNCTEDQDHAAEPQGDAGLQGRFPRNRGRDMNIETLISRGALRFRFVGAVMALTTFLTVLLFFLPLYGWSRLYAGVNFWFHLVFPLLSVASFLLLPSAAGSLGREVSTGMGRLSLKETLLPILPVLIYAAFYSINILINGSGYGPNSNDWYGFLHWGWGIGWCILAGISLATWLAGFLLRAVYHWIGAKSGSGND